MLTRAAVIAAFCSKFNASWYSFFFLLIMRMCLNPSCHTLVVTKKTEVSRGAFGRQSSYITGGYQHPCRMCASKNLKSLLMAFFKMPKQGSARINICTGLPARAIVRSTQTPNHDGHLSTGYHIMLPAFLSPVISLPSLQSDVWNGMLF